MAADGYNFELICRSCLHESDSLRPILSKNDRNLSAQDQNVAIESNLFSLEDDTVKDFTINELIMACAEVKIFENDGLPQKICSRCIEEVQNAFAYKIKCEKADLKLREYLRFRESLSTSVLSTIPSYQVIIKTEPSEAMPAIVDKVVDTIVVDPLNEWITADGAYKIPNLTEHKLQSEISNAPLDDEEQSELIGLKVDVNEKSSSNTKKPSGKPLKRCPICDRGFAKQNHLNRHLGTHDKKEYPCAYCSEVFVAYHTRRIHISTVHESGTKGRKNHEQMVFNETPVCFQNTPNGTKTCVCKICDKVFNQIASLRLHLKWHADDSDSLSNIDWEAKKRYFFDHEMLAIPNLTVEQCLAALKAQLLVSSEKLYQITNEQGWEMSISASETEDDTTDYNSFIKREPKSHTCKICFKKFERSFKIMAHIRDEHVPEAEFGHLRCHYCLQLYPNEALLAKHQRDQCQNNNKNFVCTVCNCHFMWETSLAHHLKIRHPSTEAADSAHTVMEANAIVHLPREKSFVCDLCTKGFYRHEHLERHRKIHIPEEKKFSCDLCKKCFNRKDNLKSHMRVHQPNAERDSADKHLCVYCGRSFSNSSNLIVHMRRHTGEKPYRCEWCDKGFPRSSDLQCHVRTHTGEKPCLCTICGKGFSRSNKLVRHMRIHTGIRPYKCTYCDRAFTQSNDLTLHVRRHTGEKPYVCGICGDRFIQGTALAQHRRMQGHYEESTQQSPFANISVNNPNRYTNANRVNRIGSLSTPSGRDAVDANKSNAIIDLKPVLSISISSNGAITTQNLADTAMETNPNVSLGNSNLGTGENCSLAEDSAGRSTSVSSYMENGTYSVAMEPNNQEMTTLFNLSFNQGFN